MCVYTYIYIYMICEYKDIHISELVYMYIYIYVYISLCIGIPYWVFPIGYSPMDAYGCTLNANSRQL